jgi:alkanesulfonate monooxygenase SsuD/methylene tetrahydromethanopterin reductase-like flavin-dependent oxidoreductase (luciferase family)
VLSWMGQVGARVASPLTLMREYVPALRALLAGEPVTAKGRYVSLDEVKLDWPPAAAPPLFAAGEGPKTLALTGEVADGTVLTGGTSVAQVEAARALIAEGREKAGRSGAHEIAVFVAVAFGADAEARAARQLEGWGMAGETHRVLIGDPGRVAEGVTAFHEAGADAVVLQPLHGDSDNASFLTGVAEVSRRIR